MGLSQLMASSLQGCQKVGVLKAKVLEWELELLGPSMRVTLEKKRETPLAYSDLPHP